MKCAMLWVDICALVLNGNVVYYLSRLLENAIEKTKGGKRYGLYL